MRRNLVFVSLAPLLVATALAAPTAAATTVSGGSLKIDGLSEITKGGKLTLVGFAWDGPVKLFADDFPAAGLAAATGDRSFSVASDGPVTVCQSLGRLGNRTFEEGRLSFKGAEGPVSAMKVVGVTVAGVDCARSPWTAEFQAATLEPAEARAEPKKDRDKAKSKGKAKKATKGKAERG